MKQGVDIGRWWEHFLREIQHPSKSSPLRECSLNESLMEWTRLTTECVVNTCKAVGWDATARGHRIDRLPESSSEYLSLDVMAFPRRETISSPWPIPVAVFELENSQRNERVAYSLWKILCVRSSIRIVYAYRRDWEQARLLVNELAAQVVAGISLADRLSITGETAIITGSRGESEAFPDGYFKVWLLDTNLGSFERF